MNTQIKYTGDAREALKKGVDAVADAVKVSLGAEGRNVIIPTREGGYVITKDGVSIARSILPKDRFEAIGAAIVKEAAQRTNNFAGDGTTTATVLAQEIFNRGLKLLEKEPSVSPVDLKKGIDAATQDIIQYLDEISQKVSSNNLESVATISANGDEELGKIIASAFNKIGEHGTVISELSNTSDTYVELQEGVQLDRGFYHPSFITDKIKDKCELESPFVLLNRGKLEKGDAIVNLFKQVFSHQENKLLIIADDVDPFVLSNIISNVGNGALNGRICIVKTPQILKVERDFLNDVATLTGAKIVSEIDGVKLRPDVLGKLKKAVVSEKNTLLIGDSGNLSELVSELKEKIKATDNVHDKSEIQERLSRITGGIATLYVGAKSDSELKEKQDRIEDSINATRSALEEGIVPGGGIALVDAKNNVGRVLDEQSQSFVSGYSIVLLSCEAPLFHILKNAGMEDKFLERKNREEGYGVDVKTGKDVHMMEAGIIDPKKVTRCALENAASVAGTFLTTEAVVAIQD